MAVYTGCPRCAGAPRRPASGSVLSLRVPSRHAVHWDHGEFVGCTCSVLRRRYCLRQTTNGSALPVTHHPLPMGEVFRGFPGSLSLRPVELLVPLADLTGFPPSQQGLLLPSFPSGRSPFPWSDITTVVTEQSPPMGLSPIGTSASIAARSSSLHALRR
jgi:hypothetical protein